LGVKPAIGTRVESREGSGIVIAFDVMWIFFFAPATSGVVVRLVMNPRDAVVDRHDGAAQFPGSEEDIDRVVVLGS
jgi:hypothetical protein